MKNVVCFLLFCMSFVSLSFGQATLTIENNSQRTMIVKVVSVNSYGESTHEKVTISSKSNKVIGFTQSGRFYLKTKAEISGREPIYQKGEPFNVVNDETGYSEMTITFSITESKVPQISGGKKITQQEFERD